MEIVCGTAPCMENNPGLLTKADEADVACNYGKVHQLDESNNKIALYIASALEDGGMTIVGLQQLAKSVGVKNPQRITLKVELIKAIQHITQQRGCYGDNPNIPCNIIDCPWRTECKRLVADWYR